MILTGAVSDTKVTAARAFVRSLNILLKFARLYGFDHTRTAEQFATAWKELRNAVPEHSEASLLLGTSGSQLLIDGSPLASTPAERSFAQLLSAAGIASIQFASKVTTDDLQHLVRAFPTGNAKSSVLAEQLKTALAGATGIRLNEVRFVAEDSSLAEVRTAATLTAKALGADTEQVKAWLNDPQKLLQLIAAAQGAQSGPPGSAGTAAQTGSTPAASAPGGGSPESSLAPGDGSSTMAVSSSEEDLLSIFRLLASVGKSGNSGAALDPGAFQQQVGKLGPHAQIRMREALSALARQMSSQRPTEAVLVQLAEQLAIRFALDRFERGEVRVNAVRQMLDRMNKEIEALRKILSSQEDKLARAGIIVESPAELMDRQFWASVPESGKHSVLLSPEAWCIPSRNVRVYVEELLKRGERDTAREILRNYSSCVGSEEAEARHRIAIGLGELADVYCTADLSDSGATLIEAIRQCGAALTVERETELQPLISAAFTRFGQEAATRRHYHALVQIMASLDGLEAQRLEMAQALRSRIALESRIPEFVEHALRNDSIPAGLAGVLQLIQRPSMEALTSRFSRCTFRDDGNRIAELAQQLGPGAITHLREILRVGPTVEAVETVALLSRLLPDAVEEYLPPRLEQWPRVSHDRVVRQLAQGGAPNRGHLLFELFDVVDPLVMPIILDEVGMTGDASCIERLTRFAAGSLPESNGPYLRVKAIEALGRFRAKEAATPLRAILEERKLMGWAQPEELRIVAAQAMQKIQPEWAQAFLPKSGLDPADLSLAPLDPETNSTRMRQRRYPRMRLQEKIAAYCKLEKDTARFDIMALGLGGGMARTDRHIPPGAQGSLTMQSGAWPALPGLRSGIKATVLMRDSRAQIVAFEIVSIDLGDRLKLRRLLLGLAGAPKLVPAPQK